MKTDDPRPDLTRAQWWLLSDLSLCKDSVVDHVNGQDIFKLEVEALVEADMIAPGAYRFNMTRRGFDFASEWRRMQVVEVQEARETV